MLRCLMLGLFFSLIACGGGDGDISYEDAGFVDRSRDSGPCPNVSFSRAEDGRCICNNDSACDQGKVCQGGQCLDGCRHSGHCLETERCDTPAQAEFGRCVDACPDGNCPDRCQRDSECDEGQHCQGGFCAANCTNHAECPNGQACVSSGRCSEGCRSPADCGGRATCDDGLCNCEPARAFTVVEVEDQTVNAGLQSGDNLNIVIHVPNVDSALPVGLVIQTQNISRMGYAGAVYSDMSDDGRGFRELQSGGYFAIVTFSGIDSSVTFTAVAGSDAAPVRVFSRLVMPGQQGQYCAAEVTNSRGLASLPVNGADNDLANCADMHGAHIVQMMSAQAPIAADQFGSAERDDLSWAGQDTPRLGPLLHHCIDLLGSGSLPLSSDWRGEAPVAVQGQLLFESFDMAQTEVCQNAGDCTRPGAQTCIDGQCRERLQIAMAGNDTRPLRDREHRNTEVGFTGPESCLDRCSIEPVPRDSAAWAAGDLSLSGFLRWGQRTDLRMSVLITGETVSNSAVFVQTREMPDWWLSKTCRCGHTSGQLSCGAPSDQGLDAAARICSQP